MKKIFKINIKTYYNYLKTLTYKKMLEKNEVNIHPIEIKESIHKEKTEKSYIQNLFERYKNIIATKNIIIVEDIPKYLNIIYITLRKGSVVYINKALSLLEAIISKLNETQIEFGLFKDCILEKTLIFFVLIKMYISDDNNKSISELLSKILKTLLIGNTEMIQTLYNLFPQSLFIKIQMEPEPFNWINEWEDFLMIIKQDYEEAKLIWNQKCRNELIQYLETKCIEFDEINLNQKVRRDLKETNNLNGINSYDNSFESFDEFDREFFINMSNITIDYQKYKMNYITLQDEVFVWKYYLKKLIKVVQGTPTFVLDIENPKKLWKFIKMEICLQNKPERIVIMLKVLILLYKNYNSIKKKSRKGLKPLGNFKDYDFFINLYQKYENIEVKSYIIQLLYFSVRCFEQKTKNRKELLMQEEISSIILSYIRLIESSIKEAKFSINFDVEQYYNKPPNFFYIDKEKEALKFYKDVESKFFTINNGNFINYSFYCPVDDESWQNSDDKYKLLCIVCSLYHYLKKQLKRNNKENNNDIQVFPIPNITKVLYVKNNYKAILKLLLYDNYNLSYQALNLFNYYVVDLLNDNVGNEFCIVDILFLLMIKYKSIKILRTIDKISSFYVKRNKKALYDDLKLNEEEIKFFESYSTIEKPKDPPIKFRKPIVLLIRYFPLQIIYFLMANKFEDFINLIYTKEDINTYRIIWNRKMLEDLLKSVRAVVLKHKDKLNLDKKYRYDYSCLNNKEKNFFIYYIKNNYHEVLEKINEDFYNVLINILCLEKYLEDFFYIQFLHTIIEKCVTKLNKEMKEKIKKIISSHIYPNNNDDIMDNETINKKEYDLNYLKYYLKILSLIDENENNILKYNNNINLTINKILSLDNKLSFKKEDKNARILLVLLNYLLEQPKIKNLLDAIENEKENNEIVNDSIIEKDSVINNENRIIINQNEYDNISKIVQQISRYADILFETNQSLFISFLKYFTFLCEKDKNIINYINMTILPLQLLRLCTKYKPSKIIAKDNVFFVIFRTLKTMLKNSPFLNEIMENLLSNKRLMTIFLGNGTNFLKELTQGHMRPKSIWSKKNLESLVKFLDKTINDYFIKQKNMAVIYNKIREAEKEEINNELKIGNIYIKIYNSNPKQPHCFEEKEKEKENFLLKLVNEFLKQKNWNDLKHILWSICNAMKYPQLDNKYYKTLLDSDFKELLNKFYTFVGHITHLTEEEKNKCIKTEENEIQIYKIKDTCPKIERAANICLQFIEILSSNDSTIINLQETDMIYGFILLIENTNNLESFKIICGILNNIFNYHLKKNQRDISKSFQAKMNSIEGDISNLSNENSPLNKEKRIKSIFLFLFKKLLFYSQNKKNSSEEDNSQYMELFSIINAFFNNKALDLSLKELYKYYIPSKMVDNLFPSISQEQRNDEKVIRKLFNDWLKDKIEYPDLKWNTKSFSRSYKLLCDDCQMVINDKSLIENFEKIYIETDRITENKIFFENPDEYKRDNIYLRLFNKQPNYNIGHNLPIFLLHIIDNMLDHLYDYYICSYGNNFNSDVNLIEQIKKFKEKCLITSLTSIMLIIEQINFNNKNPNLILSTDKELNNQISKKDQFSKEVLQLVKFAFDYQKLLSEENAKALIKMQKIIFYYDYDGKNKDIKIYFNSEIRIIYLQILYLIASNDYRVELLSEFFEENIILDFYFNLLKLQEKPEILIFDSEFILVCCLINKLISVDVSHIPIILAQYMDKFWNLAQKRTNVKKYIQILFKKIEMDSQYGDCLIRCKNKYNFNFNVNISIIDDKIWRLEFSEKKDIKNSKKKTHYYSLIDFKEKNKNGEFKDYEFPIILDKSLNYFKYDEFNDDLIDKELKKIKDDEISKNNKNFIINKDLLDQIQNII